MVGRRGLLGAIFYLLRTGGGRDLPHDVPPRGTASGPFHRWREAGSWEHLHPAVHAAVRADEGRTPARRPGSWAASAPGRQRPGARGRCGGAKQVTGRKRPRVVDPLGLLSAAVVHPTNAQDQDGAKLAWRAAKARLPRLERVWADRAYGRRALPAWAPVACGAVWEVVRRAAGAAGLMVLPGRRVVERTAARLGRHRRLSEGDEWLAAVGEAWIHIAMTKLMLKRLAKRQTRAKKAKI